MSDSVKGATPEVEKVAAATSPLVADASQGGLIADGGLAPPRSHKRDSTTNCPTTTGNSLRRCGSNDVRGAPVAVRLLTPERKAARLLAGPPGYNANSVLGDPHRRVAADAGDGSPCRSRQSRVASAPKYRAQEQPGPSAVYWIEFCFSMIDRGARRNQDLVDG